MKLTSVSLSNDSVTIPEGEVSILGPDLTLADCRLTSSAKRGELVLVEMVMQGGQFVQNSVAEDFHYSGGKFERVKFFGEFSGCDFGDWDSPGSAYVKNCDFSLARLHNCRFLNCEMSGTRFAPWPTFVLLNPANAFSHVKANDWPKKLKIVLNIYTDIDPECSAVVADAAVLAQENGMGLNELRRLLEAIPGFSSVD